MAVRNGISSSKMRLETLENLESVVAHFQAHTLPRENWNHRAHLGLALWTLRRFSFDESLEWLRREITDYNESVGIHNGPFSGYHETLTQFYLRAVAACLKELESTDADTLWAQLSEKWGDKNAIFAYYSRRHLFAPSTRAHFAPPDLRPLDF